MNILRRVWECEDSDDRISLLLTKEHGWGFWLNDEARVDTDMGALSELATVIRKLEKEASRNVD